MTAQPGFEPLEPTHDEIEQRAYRLWQERLKHGIEGTAEDDWFAAERELSPSSGNTPPE